MGVSHHSRTARVATGSWVEKRNRAGILGHKTNKNNTTKTTDHLWRKQGANHSAQLTPHSLNKYVSAPPLRRGVQQSRPAAIGANWSGLIEERVRGGRDNTVSAPPQISCAAALNSVSGRTSDASGVTVSPLMLHYNEPCVGKAEMNVPISDVVKSEWLWTVATVEMITRQQNR